MKTMKFPGFAERGVKGGLGKKAKSGVSLSKAWSAITKVAKSMPSGRMGRSRSKR